MRAAVALRWRAELRRRWGAWLALALIGAAAAGATTAIAAGARRTASAPDRFAVAQLAPDVILPNYDDPGAAQLDAEAIAAHPAVADSVRFLWVWYDDLALLLPSDETFGTTLWLPNLVDGWHPDPSRSDEATVSYDLAERFDIEVGDEIVGFDAEVIPLAEEAGLPTTLTIVGIEARPLELGQGPPALLAFHGTPALYEQWHAAEPDRVDGVAVALHDPERDLAPFLDDVRAMGGSDAFVFSVTREAAMAELDRTARLQSGGIWALAGVLAVTGVVLLYAAHARAAHAEGSDAEVLRAVGWTRREWVVLAALRAAAIGGASAVVGTAIAAVLSPLFPIGLTRVAEPEPGFHLDASALAIGALAAVAITVAAGTLAGLRAASTAWRESTAPAGRAIRSAGSASLGAQFALADGARGVVRATAAPAAAVVALVILGHLVAGSDAVLATPRLYGWPWQLVAERYEEGELIALDSPAVRRMLSERDDIVAAAVGDTISDLSVTVGGHQTGGYFVDVVAGDPTAALPPITRGRHPTYAPEIALGGALMERLGVDLGDEVVVDVENAGQVTATVVGEVVVPASLAGTTGGGVLLPRTASLELVGEGPGDEIPQALFLVLAPGARPDDVLESINASIGASGPDRLYRLVAAEPQDVAHLLRGGAVPRLLAVVLGVLAAGTLAAALVGITLRRAHDVAVLRSLGMLRGSARRMLACQGVCIAAVGLAVALPVGVLAGRRLWSLYSDWQGFVELPTTPWALLAAGTGCVLAAAALLAAGPARSVASAPPARHLNRE